MELNAVLRKVRALVAKAEHENTPPGEAALAREAADKLMLKFAVDEAELEASKPAESRGGPEIIDVDLAGDGTMVSYIGHIAGRVADHTRCKIRLYTRWNRDSGMWMARVYGYKSDLLYFEILYTTLRLHAVELFRRDWDETSTFDGNCYRLHNAGLNWTDIARLQGWRRLNPLSRPDVKNPYRHPDTREVWPSNKMGAVYKAAYLRECKRLGTTPVQIPASGAETYRRSALWGYSTRIGQRLEKARSGRGAAAEPGALVLRRDDLDAFYRDQNKDLFPEKTEDEGEPPKIRRKKYVPPPFNESAYASGVRHADSADIGGARVGGSRTALDSAAV